MKIRTGDTVQIIAGKDKGKRWEILKVIVSENKVIVKDVNIVTRHMKKQWTNPGQIVKFEKAIDASNVALVCPHTDKITKIGFVDIGNKKMRYSKKAVVEKGKTPSDCVIK